MNISLRAVGTLPCLWAMLVAEAGSARAQEPEAQQDTHGPRVQALSARLGSRKPGAIEEEDLPSSPCHDAREGAPGGDAPHHHDIRMIFCHRGSEADRSPVPSSKVHEDRSVFPPHTRR